MLSFDALRQFRLLAAAAALATGGAVLASNELERPLAFAILLLGGFILAHLIVEELWVKLTLKASPDTSPANDEAGAAFREAAMVYISTPGVVLGLIAVFEKNLPRDTLRVGSLALATTILAGIVLHGLVVFGVPEDVQRRALVSYIFNILLWSLGLGVLCIALAIVYR
jgi:uncharacterized membrane protein